MASPHSISLCLLFLTLLSQTDLTFSLTITQKPFNHSRTSHPLQSIIDVHDLLPLYGLPKGLIPSDIKSYTLDKSTGSFSIEMTRTCYVHFQQLVWYDKHIKGKLSYGAVHDVSGIQAKKLFLWLPVTGIETVKNSDVLRFFVGALSEDLPAEQFQEIPQSDMENHREVYIHGGHGMNDKKKTNTSGKARMTRQLIVEDERGDINELADAFIKNFRNHLKIQRDESFKRYQEMISRGI
ncbi:hypothetical protein KPL70_002316 [Citrus sinensis]|uniref:Uncharacterized protein n=1 Tax=Citrus sinensis TaxID=2711 RepID=A0ACB8MTL7_CITSI|nr:hypothetical protein KPL70_002316 [Citrus sinensis]KAH9789227.1 hypothetical protein KPL71_002907 [Citrus sinensis]